MAGITFMSSTNISMGESKNIDYTVDRFADIEVLRYDVPGFEQLTTQQKEYIYYLTEAALQGRDIFFDQKGKYNLDIRTTFEAIYTTYTGDKEIADYLGFVQYLKQLWFANGIFHHYSCDKFKPEFSAEFFAAEVRKLDTSLLPLDKYNSDIEVFIAELTPVIFDSSVMPKGVSKDESKDLITNSHSNLYEGLTQKEVEDFYDSLKSPNDSTPISYGLNSKLIKKDGEIVEQVYKVNGMYSEAIKKINYWLRKAAAVAENDAQREYIEKLIEFYTTGNLKTFDDYSILWTKDTTSDIDFLNGFIETYGDPLGLKGSWEAIVNFKNKEASKRTEIISSNAQWFEDNSPTDPRFKKERVKGVSAKVITNCIIAGDSYPATPIGINLPNSNWIRTIHGSKSVTIENITEAYDHASHESGFDKEFVLNQEDRDLMDKYLFTTDNLHTDLHECLGHGSGKLLDGVDAEALKANGATLEEARADLFALYYLADTKLIELGLLDNPDAYKANYYNFMLNALLTQLRRIELGKDVEEAHMRNRKLIAEWALDNGKADNVVELIVKDGKHYVQINNYEKLRDLFGQLLAEVQRIKSEGDYEAGRKLVEKYAVKVDPTIHAEILERNAKLNLAPYRGFINPTYKPIIDHNGQIVDVEVDYSENYVDQMLRYSRDYSPLTK
ncbi:MAG: dihydrofolate reductase [Bacteroidales bacterium]